MYYKDPKELQVGFCTGLDIFYTIMMDTNRITRGTKQYYYCLKIEEYGNDKEKMFQITNDLMKKKKGYIIANHHTFRELSCDIC